MLNPTSIIIDNNVYFKNFMVQKESDKFYGVYKCFCESKCGSLITSGISMNSAIKKAKWLQISYDIKHNFGIVNDWNSD